MAKRATLTYDSKWYVPSNIKSLLEGSKETEKQVRKEYTRLRDISQKRLKRLKAAGYENTEVYRKNVNHYPKLKDIKTKSELAQRLSDLSRFIAAETSTVSGMKSRTEKSISTLHEHGFTFVDENNLTSFGEFMESFRDEMLDMEYDSGDAAELYSIIEKHKLDPDKVKENFEFYLDNIDAAMSLRRSKKDIKEEYFRSRVEKKAKKMG